MAERVGSAGGVESQAGPVPPVRRVTLDARGVPVSGLLALPEGPPPRAVVLAVHGGGMSAGYFDSRVLPGMSLLGIGAALGFTVLAVDRPGYGASAAVLPDGQSLAEQTRTLHDALDTFASEHACGAGFFVVAHSYGGKLALSAAADARGGRLIGLDISGLGRNYAADLHELPGPGRGGAWRRHWGALRFYPPDAFRRGRDLVRPVPVRESEESHLWPGRYPGIAARVRVPVRFTFAEQERWWQHDEQALAELRGPLAAPRAEVARQPGSGHNISLGWAARTYHLKALAFLEECLLERSISGAGN
ncbi:alpha/beta hydrolase [Streptomyces albidoflavus]